MTPPFLPGEIDLLQAINGAHSPLWDAAMYLISNVGGWSWPVLALIVYLCWRKPKSEALLLLVMVGLCVACGDLLSSGVAKPFFARFRPTHTPGVMEQLHLVYGYQGKLYGFFSGHSANYTAVATLLCLTFRRRYFTLVLGTLVAWVVYSRMYIGAHFLSDCLVGILVGLLIGYGVYRLYLIIRQRLLMTGHRPVADIFSPGIDALTLALALNIPLTLMIALQITRILGMVGAL